MSAAVVPIADRIAERDLEPLVSIDDLARRYDVHPQTVRRWVRRGELRGLRIGAARFFRLSEIVAFERRMEAR